MKRVEKILSNIKFACEITYALLYIFVLDLAYQIKFCGYRGEIIVTLTPYQRLLSGMFYPMLIAGIITMGLVFYAQYVDFARKRKSIKRLKRG